MHAYGYIKDKVDQRDFVFKAVQRPEQLPPEVNLQSYCSPVRDQGMLGSCTGFAVATGLREFMQHKTAGGNSWIKKMLSFGTTTLSPLFVYFFERMAEGTIMQDAGAEIRSGMKVLAKYGVCSETRWPYKEYKFMTMPNLYATQEAAKYRTFVYSRLNTLLDIKSALAAYHGVVLGFNVYESFDTEMVALSGIMSMPKSGEELLGGHAVFCCGYKDEPDWPGGGYLILKNSWGKGWGLQGYFAMPYAFAADPNEVSDIWTASI